MPTASANNIDTLILDCLNHEIDSTRAAVLREWICASPDNAERFLRTRDLWLASTALPQASRFDPDKAYSKMMRRVDARKRRRSMWIFGSSSAIAAALLCFVTFEMGERRAAVTQETAAVYAAASGCSSVTLPDGTNVELNKGSELRFSSSFGRNARQVQLTGEGYFDVTRNENAPFEVRTANMVVTVLGTKFNISDYPDDLESCVTLIDGSLLVSNAQLPDRALSVVPNQKVTLDKSSGSLVRSITSARQSVEWMNGYLFFDDKMLADIAHSLERRYGVNVVFASERVGRLRFYGDFTHPGMTLDDILEALSATGVVLCTRQGNLVTIDAPPRDD